MFNLTNIDVDDSSNPTLTILHPIYKIYPPPLKLNLDKLLENYKLSDIIKFAEALNCEVDIKLKNNEES